MHDIANFDLVTVSALKDRTMIVPNYQRGYKWTPKEVLDLLKDIDESVTTAHQYCLQPLVLKKTEEKNTYELLDGQQRCTTIFIILSAIHPQNPPFQLSYRTRDASKVFLEEIGRLQRHLVSLLDDTAIEELWKIYIQSNSEKDNIDNYHFYRAYQVAHSWLAGKDEPGKKHFIDKLLNNSFFIWYEIEENKNPELVFQRFNSGKIQLTGAELIKAILVLNIQKQKNFEIQALELNQFALRWDWIESRLQNSEFWYFLYSGIEDPETRIDLLFNLQVDKPKNSEDPFFAYRHYDEWSRGEVPLRDKWKEVIEIFQKLVDWYSDIRLYHLIGFLINAGFRRLPEILKESEKSLSKAAFRAALEGLIKGRMNPLHVGSEQGSPYELSQLDYVKNTQRTRLVLLLFNIFSYENLLPGVRFPFWRYKEEEWTLEHIHPQNPKALEGIEEIKEWLVEQLNVLEEDQLKQKVQDLLDEGKTIGEGNIPGSFREKLEELGNRIIELLDLHGIGNLALLDKSSNSAIGNKPFLWKRQQILRKSAESGKFIPLSTRNVFVKHYTRDIGDIQMQYWSPKDADDYEEAIGSSLKDFLPKTSTHEE